MIVDMERPLVEKMEAALQQVCEQFPGRLWQYESQKFVAEKIVACAMQGNPSASELIDTASRAAASLYASEVVQANGSARDKDSNAAKD